MAQPISNVRPPPDALLAELADYALNFSTPSIEAMDTARWCLLDLPPRAVIDLIGQRLNG